MFEKFQKNNRGFTLIELVVAISLFSVVMLGATAIAQEIFRSQQKSLAAKEVQESIRYALEAMSKEIRMASLDEGVCDLVDDDQVYSVSANEDKLYFKNQDDECVAYYLEQDIDGISRLTIDRNAASAYVTPSDMEISNLEFEINTVGSQSSVTMKMDVETLGRTEDVQKIKIQTTISSRSYEQ